MDFSPNPEIVAFREEVRQVIADTVDADVRANVARTGVNHDWALMKAVADRGWLAATVPVELGGQGRGPDHLAALYRELEQADAPYEGLSMAMMIAFILGHVGSEWQKAEIMSKLLAGGAIPALGYSEPESGSDVAAAKTRAVRDGDDWIINGQKMFTSLADVSEWVFLLARTNTEVAKHRGLTFFLVPLDTPGIEVQEVRTLSGKRTNITFYDDVRVDDRMRVGDVDGGWGVMLVALAFERGVAGGVADVAALYDAAVACARETRTPTASVSSTTHPRASVSRAWPSTPKCASCSATAPRGSRSTACRRRRARRSSCSRPRPTATRRRRWSTCWASTAWSATTPVTHPAASSSTPTGSPRSSPPPAAPARSRRT